LPYSRSADSPHAAAGLHAAISSSNLDARNNDGVPNPVRHSVFITGGSGYIGRGLIPLLLKRGHQVKVLVREASESKLPRGTPHVAGHALRVDSYTEEVRGADTFVHLIGVPRPSLAKAKQFHEIDLVSIKVAIKAACDAGIRDFVYLSVAQPAPVMKAFINMRRQGEEMIREAVSQPHSLGHGTCSVPATAGRAFCFCFTGWQSGFRRPKNRRDASD
jgi:hypothetical protein